MTTPDDSAKDTQPAIEAATAADQPSWHGPVTALTARVSKLESKLSERLDSIDGNLATLAAAGSAVVKDPDVRRHALSILGSAAVILSIVAAALAGRASSPTTTPAPAPTITVVMPKEIPK